MPSVRLLLVCCIALPLATAQTLPPQTDPTGYHRNMIKTVLQDPAAQCNDGTRASFFYRNCTANADRARGDTTDYCLKGGPEGVSQNIWLIAFESAPGFCHDQSSCAARLPRLTSSNALPSTLFPGGALSVYPEENPNLYKASTAFVPSCSSDLWLGANTSDQGVLFRGRLILEAVLRALTSGAMQHADVIVVSGGAGVMQLFQTARIRALLPPGAVLKVVCDDCLLLGATPRVSVAEQPCSNDLDCPAADALPIGIPRWNASMPEGCFQGACLLWPSDPMTQLLSSKSHFVFQHLFAESQLRALRAWPPVLDAQNFSVQLSIALQSQLRDLQSDRVFAPSCGSEQGPVSFTNQRDFFKTLIATTNQYNVSGVVTFSSGVADLVHGLSESRAAIDNCTGFECNRVDNGFREITRCGRIS